MGINGYPLVSVRWLNQYLNAPNLIILDASITKVTASTAFENTWQIPNARFFDLKKKFSAQRAEFPNTVPSAKQFTLESQKLGINDDSLIVVYDDKGIYSSARVWYLFKAFGFDNIAVLDGGLPEWIANGYKVEEKNDISLAKGNFIAKYKPNSFKFFNDIQESLGNFDHLIVDARSENRFKGLVPEPRKGLRSGHIPNSVNLPFTNLLDGNRFKSKEDIAKEFGEISASNKHFVFSCGSGITACILALGAEIIHNKNISVYDGSWTEYGSLTIQKNTGG